jgi:uncharacterized membrane protein YdjX (TVP38/TMEM64 family)
MHRAVLRWTLVCLAMLAVILVPFFLVEDRMNDLAGGVLAGRTSRGVAAAALAALLASDIVLPVPSSILSTAAGGLLGFGPGVLVSWAGMSAACVFGYALARRAGTAGVSRWLGEEDLEHIRTANETWRDGIVILFRPVPVLAEASVFFAGLVKMPFRRFFALTALSNLGISAVYAAVGAAGAELNSFLLAFAGAIAAPAVFLLIARTRRRA